MAVEGKVARVLTDYEVVFNVGEEDGVEAGDVATVSEPVEISDPDTAEPLGQVYKRLVQLEIDQVSEHLSVGKTTDYVAVRGPLDVFGTSKARRVRKRVTENPSEEDSTTVFVPIGALVEIGTADELS